VRVDLLGGASFRSDDPYADERTDRERLLAGTGALSEGSQRLANTHRIALEAEDVGVDILRNLRVQRESIENTRDTVRHYPFSMVAFVLIYYFSWGLQTRILTVLIVPSRRWLGSAFIRFFRASHPFLIILCVYHSGCTNSVLCSAPSLSSSLPSSLRSSISSLFAVTDSHYCSCFPCNPNPTPYNIFICAIP